MVYCAGKLIENLMLFYKSNIPHFLWVYRRDNPLGMLGEYEKSLGSEMWKIKLPKIVGNLLEKFRNFLYMKGRVFLIFVAICPQATQNSRQYLLLRTRYFVGCLWRWRRSLRRPKMAEKEFLLRRRQCSRVVRALDLQFRGREFKSRQLLCYLPIVWLVCVCQLF